MEIKSEVKIQNLKRKKLTALFCLLLTVYCFSGMADAKEAIREAIKDSDVHQITNIEAIDNAVKIKVNGPIKYKISNPDPFRVIVDIEGVSLGEFKDKIYSRKAGITEIALSQAESPVKTSRLDILLQSPSIVRSEIKDNALMLYIESQGAARHELLLADKEISMPEIKSNKKIKDAEEIIAVLFDKTDKGVEVIIKGDGAMPEPVVLELDGKIMIDIHDVAMKAYLPSNMIYPVKGIKYKAEKEKVRFIVDSADKVDTEAFVQEDEIVIDIAMKESKVTTQDSAGKRQEPKSKTQNSRVVSLDFQDADIVPILRLIGEVGGYNIVVHPEIKGTITMKLLNVPWEQALDVILKTFSLEKIVEGNVIRVVTRNVYVEELKAGEAVEAANVETRVFVVNYADVEQVRDSLEKAGITKKENISIDKLTRSVIIRDNPSNFKEIERLISAIDKATPQILIETKIVEVISSFTRELGIQWGFEWLSSNWRTSIGGSVDPSGAPTGLSPTRPSVTGGQFPVAINLPAQNATSAITFGYLNAAQTFGLDLRLSAFEDVGKSKIISNPKIITTDNQKAKIILGESIPYGEREVSGGQVTISTKFKDVAIIIEVTPQITADNSISLNVDAKKEDLIEFVPIGPETTAPRTNKVEANTNVLIKDSETMVIGGILRKKEIDKVAGVPGLMNIPVLGWLFKRKATDENNTEVLIFITPRIVRQ